ncbi:MAG: Peptidase M24, Xaa-Pro dipeptidase [Nitrosopumilales archaeon]|nr:MAG: Peptidase M24, Xaa-Pro dipeptidase [Nitrosopumilales archaeon]
MKNRRSVLLKYAQKLNCDTLVAFEPENLFYMTGFWGEAISVLDKNGTNIIAPALEVGRARTESKNCDVVSTERGTALVSSLVSKIKNKRVCTDCSNYDTMTSLKKSVRSIKHSTKPFYNARMIKDSSEIAILKKASKTIDEMFGICARMIKKGQKESELQAILMSYGMERGMFDTGYRGTLNPLIIAGGPNGALPHAQVTDRKFANGDMIVVDITLRYKGYVSDATRTFGLGKVSSKTKDVYEIVKESQKLGLRAVKPKTSCKSIDDSCRDFIKKKKFGKYFIHSTGHGIGLEVHELPNISQLSKTKLEKNMAITVEPGIYIPKNFGVRIEDSLMIGTKAIPMHKFTKDLMLL